MAFSTPWNASTGLKQVLLTCQWLIIDLCNEMAHAVIYLGVYSFEQLLYKKSAGERI